MSLDHVVRIIVRNFSTLFLVVFGILLPMHLIYGLFFQDVFVVRDLHPAIAEFPERRMVRGVGRSDVAQARLWFWILAVLELALIPLFVRALARVVALDRAGRLPDAVTAWKTIGDRSHLHDEPTPSGRTLAACVGIGVAIGALVWLIASVVVELVPDNTTAFGIAIADATSRAAGAAFALTAVSLHHRRRTEMKL